jgi:hypothetical protein
MHTSIRVVVISAALALAACGGSSDNVPHGSGTLTGGASFTVLSGYENAPEPNGSPDLSNVEMVLVDQNWSCGDLQSKANAAPPHQFLELVVRAPSALTPGTYQVQPIGTPYDGAAIAELGTFLDGNSGFSATSGTLTLETISATEMKGSFDVTDSGGASLSGTFDTHFCSVPSAFQ